MLTSEFDIFMSPELQGGLLTGTRTVMVLYITDDNARRLLPSSVEEVVAMAATVERTGARLGQGRQARVKSPAGTDLTMAPGHWSLGLHHGRPGPGQVQVLPAGQVAGVPKDGTAGGA